MCGRIDFHDPKPFLEDLQKYYDWDISDYIRYETAATGYNIPPSSDILTWHEHHHTPLIEPMHWGLIPFWAKDPAIGNHMINAKNETLAGRRDHADRYPHPASEANRAGSSGDLSCFGICQFTGA